MDKQQQIKYLKEQINILKQEFCNKEKILNDLIKLLLEDSNESQN